MALSNARATASTPATILDVTRDPGFDWGDAAIGAGATLVLVAVGLAGTRAATNSRKRHTLDRRATANS